MIFVLAGIFGLAYVLFAPKPAAKNVMGQKQTVYDAIVQGIVSPLGLPQRAADALYAQAVLETGNFTSKAFMATNSLFNRHKGLGHGDWTGRTFYANPGDADLRIFTDVYQSARDMRQLLSDGLYRDALAALRQGSPDAYFVAVARAGFAADPGYAANLKRTYQGVA